jgi:hypothetical protein
MTVTVKQQPSNQLDHSAAEQSQCRHIPPSRRHIVQRRAAGTQSHDAGRVDPIRRGITTPQIVGSAAVAPVEPARTAGGGLAAPATVRPPRGRLGGPSTVPLLLGQLPESGTHGLIPGAYEAQPKVLLAFDGSPAAASALPLAETVADQLRANLEVVVAGVSAHGTALGWLSGYLHSKSDVQVRLIAGDPVAVILQAGQPRAPLGSRAPSARRHPQLDRAPLVSLQDRGRVPRPAHRAPPGTVADRLFSATGPITTPPKSGSSSLPLSATRRIMAQVESSSLDGNVWLWDTSLDSWLERVCRVANRNLALAEWAQITDSEAPYERTCPNLPSGT